MLSRQGPGAILLSASTSEGLGQVPHLVQVFERRGEEDSFPSPMPSHSRREGHDLLSHPHALRPSHPCPYKQISSIALPGEGRTLSPESFNL